MQENTNIRKQNIRRKLYIISFLFKILFFITGVIFFLYLGISAVLISSSNNPNAEIVHGGDGKLIPALTKIVIKEESVTINEMLNSIVPFLFTIVSLIMVLIFISPVFLIIRDLVKNFMSNIGNFKIKTNDGKKESNVKTTIYIPFRYKLLKITEFLYHSKTQDEVFKPTMADWDYEIYEALKKDRDAKLFMINVRNTYAFLLAMWQKSPIGDLIQFVVKIAKG